MKNTAAFTLFELAIVLVIIGLLVGGVMVGQTLVHAAELRAVTTESDKFKAAINSFRDKYNNLPGDMTNATSFWGALDPTQATCDTMSPAPGSTATCNGDGNQQVGLDSGQGYEPLRFWQHLGNALLVEGSYSGTGLTPPGYTVRAKTNVPASRYPNAAWCTRYRPAEAGDSTYFNETFGNHLLVFGADSGTTPCDGKIMKAEDALHLDIKMDDGKPAMGTLQAMWRTDCTNATGPADYTASYKLSDGGINCTLLLRKIF